MKRKIILTAIMLLVLLLGSGIAQDQTKPVRQTFETLADIESFDHYVKINRMSPGLPCHSDETKTCDAIVMTIEVIQYTQAQDDLRSALKLWKQATPDDILKVRVLEFYGVQDATGEIYWRLRCFQDSRGNYILTQQLDEDNRAGQKAITAKFYEVMQLERTVGKIQRELKALRFSEKRD
jgi:hypothetical protein